MAITRAQQAKQLLQSKAPKGEFLAYINKKEAKMLKDAGGSGIMTNAGIPSFVEYGGQSGFEGAKERNVGGGNRDNERDNQPKGRNPMAQFRDKTKISQEAKNRLEKQRVRAQQTIEQQRKDARAGKGPFAGTVPLSPTAKFKQTFVTPTQKVLYNLLPNNPKNELDYLRSLPASQRALLSPALRAKLEDLELDEEQGFGDVTGSTKFTFDEFEELKNFQPTDGSLNFAEYAATYKGAPGLKFSGNVGNLEKFVSGVDEFGNKMFDYREKRDGPDNTVESDIQRRLRLLEEQNAKLKAEQDEQDSVKTDDDPRNLGGMMTRALGSDFDFSLLADGGRVPAMDGGIMDTEVMGGLADGSIDEMGRQMYGLGKLVKSVTRGIKKVAKSPIGKIALLAGGAGLLSGGGLGTMFSKKGLSDFFFAGKDMALKNLTQKGLLTGLAGISALPLLFQEEEEEPVIDRGPGIDIARIRNNPYAFMAPRFEGSQFAADGGRIGYQKGGDAEPVAKKTMPLIDMDGMEKDYRETGGFVEMGRMERADDVPARLSKNEFVFTADAVRNAGDGNIDKGAEVMYNMMKNLEAGGEVSEESQGLEGARKMFQTSQRLGEVI